MAREEERAGGPMGDAPAEVEEGGELKRPWPQHVQDAPPPHPGGRQRTMTSVMNAAINEIGAGPYQLIVLMLGGSVYMVEGSYLLMLSIIAKSLIKRWDLSPWAAGSMASLVFSGLLVGTITGGVACDHYGRRMPILVTYFGISIFTIAGILSPGLLLLLVAKFLLGVCLGFGVPAANAIVAESCPPSQRSNIYCMTMLLFSLGQLYSATVVWTLSPMLKHHDMEWRSMLAASAILPGVLLVLAYFFLQESPHWLMLQCRISEARAVVSGMLRLKQHDEGPERYSGLAEAVDHQLRTPKTERSASSSESESGDRDGAASGPQAGRGSAEDSPLLEKKVEVGEDQAPRMAGLGGFWQCLLESRTSLGALFSESYRRTTVVMLYVTFASNFAYYGMIYGLPDTLKRASLEDAGGWSPAAGLFLSAVFEIPGVFLAIVLGMTIGRRVNMGVAFSGCAVSLVVTVGAISAGQITGNAGLASVLSIKLFLTMGYIVVYLYLLECYPTKFRATGLAFCMVLGRLGAAACPFVFDGLSFLLGTDVFFFLFMASMMAGASVACCFLPYETKDAALEEDAPPGTCTPCHEVALRQAHERRRAAREPAP